MPVQVLIIEDSRTQASRLKLVLEQEGVAVTLAETGQGGIASAIQSPPAAVVLDVNLPDVDGFRVCQILKNHPATARVPVVMFTVRDRARDTLSGLHAGADAYIPKGESDLINLLQALRDLAVLAEVEAE
jgi:DNA-binding response OmpR family regulator